MPRVTLLDRTDDADVQAAVALLTAAGADPDAAAAAVDTLVAGVPSYVDVERTDSVVAGLAAIGIEAEVETDDKVMPAD